jgi:hypothetical protein
MPSSSKKRGHFRKKPDVVQIPPQKERHMEKTPEKEPHGPPPPPPSPLPAAEPPAEEPIPSHGPHWHEGDPEPKEEGD